MQVKRRVDDCRRRTKKGDTLHIHYIGSLQVDSRISSQYIRVENIDFGALFFHTSLKESGVEFDRSRKEEPFAFTIGSSQVILIRMLLNKYRRKCIFVN